MYRIAVIGAGQLGSRHLQGIAKLDLESQIFVVDPSPQSLEVARTRINETGIAGIADRITYHTSIDVLPETIDYAVIATAADVRLNVLQSMLNGRSVGNLLLEKVLFQRVADYQVASELLRNAGTKTWVNCPRRAFPIYQTVQKFFEGQDLLYFQVYGGQWGLGCNSIHFIDLLAFLASGSPHELSTTDLDQALIPSKRANFYEFTGTLRGKCGTAIFEITSRAQSGMQLMVMLRSENRTCLIDEAGGQAYFYENSLAQPWSQQTFRNPFVSELSTVIARDALVLGKSALTTFDDSVAFHLPLIQALGTHAAKALGTASDICPIT